MSCGGLNQFTSFTVPVLNGDGPALDVSGLVAKKTIYLSGEFDGDYTIMGSQDNVIYVPIVSFRGGLGPQTIRTDIEASLRSMLVRRNANRSVVVDIAAQATCSC